MKYRLPFAVLGLSLGVTPLGAQDPYLPQCPDQQQVTQDACVKAIDLFRYLAPQLGTAIAGGNAILGSGGTLGGLGHISFGLRVNAVGGDLPRIDDVAVSTGGRVATNFGTKSQIILLPTADLAIGVFGGLPLGLTNVGGLDLLLSASYLPEFDANNVSVEVPGGSVKLGLGARLGLIQESLFLPGVAVSILRRDLPRVNVVGRAQGDDSVAVTGFEANTTSWRLTAGKSFMMFGLAIGGGRDRYSYDADVTATVNTLLGGPVSHTVSNIQNAEYLGVDLRKLTRTSYFADLSLNLPFFRLVGEIGQVSGGDIPTFNTFGGKPADKSRVYGSIGARFGW